MYKCVAIYNALKNVWPGTLFRTTLPSGNAVQLSFLKQYQICEPIPLAFYILRACVLKFLLKYFWKSSA